MKGGNFVKTHKFISILCIFSVIANFFVPISMAKNNTVTNKVKSEIVSYLLPEFEVSEGYVSRRDFIKNIIALRYGEKNNSVTPFMDVEEFDDGSGEIAYAVQMGIVDKGELFFPDLPVNIYQAAKIASNILGYGDYARFAGGYPSGYMAISDEIELFEGIQIIDYITWEQFEAFLFNVLTAPVYSISFDNGDMVYYSDKEDTLLTEKFNIYEFDGIETANYLTGLTEISEKTFEHSVKINGEEYLYFNESDYLGYRVKGYFLDDDGEKTIISMAPEKTETVTINTKDIDSFDGERLTYFAEDKDKTLKTEKGYSFIYNKKAYEKTDAKEVILNRDGEITLIDSDDNGIFETILMTKKDYMPISFVNTFDNLILSEDNKYGMIDLSKEDVIFKITKDNKEATLYDIQKGELLCYTVSDDGLYYELETVLSEVSGKVLSYDKEEKTVLIGESEYKFNSFFEKFHLNTLTHGKEYTFLADDEGNICHIVGAENIYMYGWIIRSRIDEENECVSVKMFTENGKVESFSVVDKPLIDGEKIIELNLINTSINGLDVNNKLIRYMLDKNGKIAKMDFSEDASGAEPAFEDKKDNDSMLRFYQGESVDYYSNGKVFVPKFKLNDTTKIFIIPKSTDKRLDDSGYELVTSGYFQNATNYTVTAYDIDRDNGAGAVILFDDRVGTLGTEAPTAVVDSITQTLNEDDEVIYKISLLRNGSFFALEVNPGLNEKVKALNPGDLIRYNENGKGELLALNREYDCKNDILLAAENPQVRYSKGFLYNYNNGYIGVLKKDSSDAGFTYKDIDYAYVGNVKVCHIYLKLDSDGNVKNVSLRQQPDSVMKSYKATGKYCDKAIMRFRFYALNSVWIYHIEY